MLDRTSSTPLYVQVRDILLNKMDNNEYPVNEMIPSEKKLCEEFGISRETLRSVLTELVRDGRLYRVQGKGTYVAEPKLATNTTSYFGLREQFERQGHNVTTILLGISNLSCPVSVARHLNISQGSPVYYIQRLRKINGEPLSIHNSYIPIDICPKIENNDFCNTQLCDILSTNYGLKRSKSSQTLESVLARENEATLLNIKTGYPLLKLSETITNENNLIFEYSTIVLRGDKVELKFSFEFNENQ